MTDTAHNKLALRAMRWLRNSATIADHKDGSISVRCRVVLGHLLGGGWEVPDAIGWFAGGTCTILVEAKISRADFKKDGGKSFRRRPATGMGNYRYYLTKPGLIATAEVPKDWGLLEVLGRSVRVKQLATWQDSLRPHETQLLWSALRKWQTTEAKLKTYRRET